MGDEEATSDEAGESISLQLTLSTSTDVSVITELGKLVTALRPLSLTAALSYSEAASSAVSKVPSQTRFLRVGSRISAAHRPHGLCRTPLNFFRRVTAADSGDLAGLFLRTSCFGNCELEGSDGSLKLISLTSRLILRTGLRSGSSSLEESVASGSVCMILTSFEGMAFGSGTGLLVVTLCSEYFTLWGCTDMVDEDRGSSKLIMVLVVVEKKQRR